MTGVFCGIGWAEGQHDIALVDSQGLLLASQRVDDSATGLAELLYLLSTNADRVEDPIPVAIETLSGLLVAPLRTNGRAVYAIINPMAVASCSSALKRNLLGRSMQNMKDHELGGQLTFSTVPVTELWCQLSAGVPPMILNGSSSGPTRSVLDFPPSI